MRLSVTIRPYRDADFDAVTWLLMHSWKSAGVGVPINLTLVRRGVRLDLAKGCSCHVATQRSRIVGYIAFNGDELDSLFVLPARQNCGIGKQLLDFAKREKPSGFWLRALAQNIGARRFYEREGLRFTKTTVRRRPGYRNACYEWQPYWSTSRPRAFSASLRKQIAVRMRAHAGMT